MIPLKYFEPYVQSPMEHFGIFSLCLSRAKLKFNEKIRVNPENAYGIICQFKSSSTSIAHSLFAWKKRMGWLCIWAFPNCFEIWTRHPVITEIFSTLQLCWNAFLEKMTLLYAVYIISSYFSSNIFKKNPNFWSQKPGFTTPLINCYGTALLLAKPATRTW